MKSLGIINELIKKYIFTAAFFFGGGGEGLKVVQMYVDENCQRSLITIIHYSLYSIIYNKIILTLPGFQSLSIPQPE